MAINRIIDIFHVPVAHKPTTRRGYHKTQAWERKRVLSALEVDR